MRTVAWLMTLTMAVPCVAQERDRDLPPAGYGTLRQDDIVLRLQTENLQVTILPLDEHLLRLLARDSYSALHQLVQSRDSAITEALRVRAIDRPSLFLVTLFALDRGVLFEPDDLTIQSRNQVFQPVATIPITPQWDTHRVEQRATATAIYVFEPGIEMWEPMVVTFAGVRNGSWERTLQRLDQERAAVLARAAAAQSDTVRN